MLEGTGVNIHARVDEDGDAVGAGSGDTPR
jgi:hypothetical protein